jgi:hypothetical protein
VTARGDGRQHEIPAPAGDRMGDENAQPATFEEFTVQDKDDDTGGKI